MSDEFKNGTCAPSDCASCGLDCGSNSSTESHNTITLTLDDDTEIECAILTVFPVDAQEYIALLPLDENGQNQDGEVINSPVQKQEIQFLPTSKVMMNMQKLQRLLTLFLTMHVRQKPPENLWNKDFHKQSNFSAK